MKPSGVTDIDYGATLRYPVAGADALKRHAVGAGSMAVAVAVGTVLWVVALLFPEMWFLPWLVVPVEVGLLGLWFGYFVSVARSTYRGETDPPPIDDWRQLAGDGLRGLVVFVVYQLPFVAFVVVAAVGIFGVLGAAVDGSSAGAAASTGEVAAGFIGIMLLWAVTVLGGLAYYAVVGYLFPISLLSYADGGHVRAAFSWRAVRAVGFDTDYLLPWLGTAVVLGSATGVVWVLSWVFVGYLLAPFLPVVWFYLGIAAMRAFGQVYRDGVGVGGESESRAGAADESLAPGGS